MFLSRLKKPGGVCANSCSHCSLCRCAGLCRYEFRGGYCSIRLSEPLLKLRSRKDLVETLLVIVQLLASVKWDKLPLRPHVLSSWSWYLILASNGETWILGKCNWIVSNFWVFFSTQKQALTWDKQETSSLDLCLAQDRSQFPIELRMRILRWASFWYFQDFW